MFNLAKGVLVVDPIEVRGIYTKHKPSQIYLLFQINTTVKRSNTIPTNSYELKWNEDSQCRFDIGPSENTPKLRIFLMERTNPLPLIIDECEVDLMEIFVKKKIDKRISFIRLGQLNVEFTFYDLAPLIPVKGCKKLEPEELIETYNNDSNDSNMVEINGSSNVKIEKKELKEFKVQPHKLISAVDQVFDDTKEERGRFSKLMKKVKRRYKSVDYSTYQASRAETKLSRKPSIYNPLELEIKVAEQHEKSKGSSPVDSTDITLGSSESLDTKDVGKRLNQLDLNSLPFSADEIGSPTNLQMKIHNVKVQEINKKQQETRANYRKLSPEEFSFAMRLERGTVKPEDFAIERGASEYNGDGTWNKGCLRDSYRVIGNSPKLPPRIPIGMTNEEYFVINKGRLQTI